ncbi:46186_t:CDS:2 [Gigaspora margarita]|uniref:46186_t:CDS:1 n=1 Tax=Gigaspora margarita TaxID=4874 RepID=A0ABM8W0J8_GIGMA|nr:46186_t:CDS:2 [Gigaspora margarita]
MTNKKKNFYFDNNEPDTWSILNFHKAWINKYKNNDPEKLQFQKANNALVRVLHSIIDNCRDNKKVEKAKSILNIKMKPLINNKNDQLLEDYCSLFNDDNVEELSQLIDDHILNKEMNLSNFNEINFELEKLNFQKLKNSFEKYQNLIPSLKKVVIPAYWGILDLTKESLFNWKDIDNKLLNEVSQLFTNTIAWLPKTAPKILQEYFNTTNEARNESNNPFQRAKVGHKADMKGILKNTSCKLEALYGEVSGGLGPFGLSIASRKKKYLDKVKLSIIMHDLSNKALKQWRHINDDGRKSLIVYEFTQDESTTNHFFLELEISFYAMSWFEEIYLFGRIDSCTIPSEKNDYYLFEDIYCVLTELEETVRKLHSDDIINKRKLITQENSPILNTNRTPSKH